MLDARGQFMLFFLSASKNLNKTVVKSTKVIRVPISARKKDIEQL